MKIIEVIQGTPEWAAIRANHHCASEAAAMMGVSKYQTRNDLLRQKALGITEEIDEGKQRLFNKGHEAEAAARPLVEAMICDDLYPTTATDDTGYLLASFDGITMDGTIGFEHKLMSESLAAQVRAGELGPEYYWQLEHQLIVGGMKHIVFVCSDGTPDKFESLIYRAVPGRAEQLMAGWCQFEDDLANYTPPTVIPAAVAAPQMALPAVTIQVSGSIALIDNLDVFGQALASYVDKLNTKPETDQDFANLEAAVKTLKAAEEALDGAENGALAQAQSIDTMRRQVGQLRELARSNRLLAERVVKAEKENRRNAIIQEGKDSLSIHIEDANKRLGKSYIHGVAVDFAGKVKGLKTLASIKNAVETELARCKIEVSAIADRIQLNLNSLRELSGEHTFLFVDAAQLVQKANDDLVATIKSRIAEHKAAEDRRIEAEREKIRAEEAGKLQAEAAAAAAKVIEEDRKPKSPAWPIEEQPKAHVPNIWQIARDRLVESIDGLSVTEIHMVAGYITKLRKAA